MKLDTDRTFKLELTEREAEMLCALAGATQTRTDEARAFIVDLYTALDNRLPFREESFSDLYHYAAGDDEEDKV